MLINGNIDNKILDIKDNSIDLIIADIPWANEKIGSMSYDELFSHFKRVLKQTGVCCVLVKTSSSLHAFLQYCLISGKYFYLIGNFVFIENDTEFGNIIILSRKDNNTYATKVIYGEPSIDHKLSDDIFMSLILAFTKYGNTVLDPFMGWGGSAKVSKQLGRKYIGIEIDKERFDYAKRDYILAQEIVCHVS